MTMFQLSIGSILLIRLHGGGKKMRELAVLDQ